jgi:hypothetical protein
MPPAQQNTLVQRYCTVCHTDKSMNGGLSLEHFDAARPDPGDAAMIVSKMKSGAFDAAGIPAPDQATQDALIGALSASAAGASRWPFRQAAHRPPEPRRAREHRAGVVSSANHGEPDLYRLTLTCRAAAHEGVQLAWSPNVPGNGQRSRRSWTGPAVPTGRRHRRWATAPAGRPGQVPPSSKPCPCLRE